MFKKKNEIGNGVTIIAKGVAFKGTLEGKGSFRIDGDFHGEINAQGDITIGKEGKVDATVRAGNLEVAGLLKGKATVNGRLYISATGRVEADVKADRLAVEEGGVLLGQCNACPETKSPTTPTDRLKAVMSSNKESVSSKQ
ncbi:MAG: polymer-forming cytoskeletal protein [Peptococcaceae bacterium]|nr:polymer-forming cytoskeletal protein [Peptococcaceae bacterium]